MEKTLLPHEFTGIDDCIRCLHCEVLLGTPGPCNARRDEEPPAPDVFPFDDWAEPIGGW